MDSGLQTRIEFYSSGISGAGRNVPSVGLRGSYCENKKLEMVAPVFRPEDKPVCLQERKTGTLTFESTLQIHLRGCV